MFIIILCLNKTSNVILLYIILKRNIKMNFIPQNCFGQVKTNTTKNQTKPQNCRCIHNQIAIRGHPKISAICCIVSLAVVKGTEFDGEMRGKNIFCLAIAKPPACSYFAFEFINLFPKKFDMQKNNSLVIWKNVIHICMSKMKIYHDG